MRVYGGAGKDTLNGGAEGDLLYTASVNPQDYDYRGNSITDWSATKLFSTWDLGPIQLHHRMVKSAAGSATYLNGLTDELFQYYVNFAKGGVDLLSFQVAASSILNGLHLKDFRRQIHSHILVCMVLRGGEVTIPDGNFCLQAGDLVSIIADRSSAAAFFEKIGVVRSRIRNVMIAGGGKISYYLVKDLLSSNISTTIIESDPARCDELTELFPKATVILGDATDQNLLLEEGLSSTDGFAALTGIDEENILLSLYANRMSSDTAKTVTKIGRLSFHSLIDNLDIGSVIYPQDLVASHIIRFVRSLDLSMRRKSGCASSFETLYKLAGGKAEALEFRITEKSPVAGIPLSQMKIRPNVMIGCIYRHGTIITPSGSDHLEEGDYVIVVATGVRILDISDILEA